MDADEITTWTQDNQRILLLKGQVLVQQSIIQARFQQGVVWVDLDRFRQTRILHVDVYGEGNVRLENGSERQSGDKMFLDLNSRGELKLTAHKSKAIQKTSPDDPLYQRGLKEKSQSPPPVNQQKPGPGDSPPAPRSGPAQPDQQTDPLKSPAGPDPRKRSEREAPAPIPGDEPIQLAQFTPQPAPPAAPIIPGPTPANPVWPTAPVMPPADSIGSPPAPVPPVPGRTAPGPPAPARAGLGGFPAPFGGGSSQQISIGPRTGMPFDVKSSLTPSGEQVWLVTGGVILNIRDQQTGAIYDIEADRLVFWTRGESPLFGPNPQPQDSPSQRQLEFYLSGNVEIRKQHNVPNKPPESRILRADEVYYDISRSVAIAVRADLEFKEPTMPDPVHFKADELLRLSPTQWQVLRGEVFSSKLASDPGFKIYFARATLEDKHVPKKNIFDVVVRNPRTGEPEIELQRWFRAEEVFFELEEVPVFYLPFLAGDAKDPLGPVRNIMLSYSKIFGGQFGVTLDGFDLLGIAPPPGERWHITADYLTAQVRLSGRNLTTPASRYSACIPCTRECSS